MFSISPRFGTFSVWNIWMARPTSAVDTSCGVETTTAPVIGMLCDEQDWHVRPVDVGVEDAGPGPQLRQREGKVHGRRGFTDAAFPSAHGHDVLDALDLLHLRDRAGARDLSIPLDLRLRRPGQGREGGV